MGNICDSWWICYEQVAVVFSLLLALAIVRAAFTPTKLRWNSPFVATLTWDFSRSWATNVSGLAAVVGVAVVSSVTTDFKPFSQTPVKSSYTVTAVLMAAVVIAAPSIYTLLQERKENQLVGCAGGFIAASMLTIWGTIAQLLLQAALLVAFVLEKPGSRFALLLVPLILLIGLILLCPYSIRSIQVALANETQAQPSAKQTHDQQALDRVQPQTGPAETGPVTSAPVPRRVAIL
jgi:hypothetical protein